MAFDNLLVERDGAVPVVTINRPTVLNALNAVTVDELPGRVGGEAGRARNGRKAGRPGQAGRERSRWT